ncbi:UNVERIFIED_CONTAM: hypothetical protein PYX00_011817 [Menopon gallinae]|uniref:CID domain-containing protein n=1 Tax=Menopon gallinae TaxID=328185 RepID=A0AAW2H8L1_9NEOP
MLPEKIVEDARICIKNQTRAVCLVEDTLPEVDAIRSFEEFQEICELLDLPVLDREMLDPRHHCRNMLVYLVNMSTFIPMDLGYLIRKNQRIEEYLALDEKIDELEVRLANLKNDYELASVERLDIAKEVERLERMTSLDEETLFSILKHDGRVQRLMSRDRLIKAICAADDSPLKRLFVMLIENEHVSIKDVEAMGMDRIVMLKLLYQLCLKEIIVYDQLNELISLSNQKDDPMSLLSREYLITSLRCLQPTQENMQTVALYIRINKDEHVRILEIYANELMKSNVFHQLNLYYLANEILQTEKRNTSSKSLYQSVKSLVQSFFKGAKAESVRYPKLFKKYCGLEEVWVQREIFSREELEDASVQKAKDLVEQDLEPLPFSRERVLEDIDKLFYSGDELVVYLKKFIQYLES